MLCFPGGKASDSAWKSAEKEAAKSQPARIRWVGFAKGGPMQMSVDEGVPEVNIQIQNSNGDAIDVKANIGVMLKCFRVENCAEDEPPTKKQRKSKGACV